MSPTKTIKILVRANQLSHSTIKPEKSIIFTREIHIKIINGREKELYSLVKIRHNYRRVQYTSNKKNKSEDEGK